MVVAFRFSGGHSKYFEIRKQVGIVFQLIFYLPNIVFLDKQVGLALYFDFWFSKCSAVDKQVVVIFQFIDYPPTLFFLDKQVGSTPKFTFCSPKCFAVDEQVAVTVPAFPDCLTFEMGIVLEILTRFSDSFDVKARSGIARQFVEERVGASP